MNPELLSTIVESTGKQTSTGYWSFDPATGDVAWSQQTFRILGYTPEEVTPTYELFRGALHDSQRDAFEMELTRAAKRHIPYVFEGTVTTPDGHDKRIRAMGKMRRVGADQQLLMVGMIRDISDEHARQQTLGTALRWLETASEIARLGYWYLDVALQSLEWSEEVYRIHGHEPGAFTPSLGQAIDAYHPDDRERIAAAVRRGQESGKQWSVHARLIRADGEVRQVTASGRPMYDQDRLVALFGVIQDVTAKEQRVANDRLFVSLVQQTPEGICITDAEGLCVWMNDAFEQLSGFSQDDMHGQRPGQLLQGPETDPATVERIRAAMASRHSCTEDILNYRKDGQPYWVRLSIFPHRDQNGALTHFMSIQADITEQKEAEARLARQSRSLAESNFYLERQRAAAESMADKDRQMREELEKAVAHSRQLQEELRHLAHYDELTGLPNRRYVLQRAAAEHKRARRYGRPMSVVMVDIDYFKRINDELGHAAGDKAICHVALLLEEALRDGVDLCGRLGGEEFVLVLPETNLAGAVQVAERLRETLAENPFSDDRPVHCSFGIADASDYEHVEGAIKAADQMLYAAKQAGRNRVMF